MSQASGTAVQDAEAFQVLDRTLEDSGPAAVLDTLIQQLAERAEFRALLDALLLRARFDLGLPLIQVGSLGELPEPVRSMYEEKYVEAIRTVGGKLLANGEIAAAWPYFRAIGETEPVARAIDSFEAVEGDESVNQIIEVAFNQGANPRRGFELILNHYGTCSAISAFEHLPHDEAVRVACADQLVRQLSQHLTANLRAEITQRGQPLPPEETPLSDLVAGRDWLFIEDAYHIDISHLAATVRLSTLLTDPASIALAAGLCEYGCHLSPRHQYEGEPPFEQTYQDHRLYLRALLGLEVDTAVAHFRAKLTEGDPDQRDGAIPAQVLVGLLIRADRLDEAIDVAAEHLANLPDSALSCPGISQLCQRAGRNDRLATIAREHGNLVQYAAAILQTRSMASGTKAGN